MTYILAASVPDAPASPSFGWATDNSINVLLALTEESNGALFSSHELWIAIGEDGQDFTQVKSYIPTSQSLQHTLTFAVDGIVTGLVYSFKFRAKNSKGYSEFSNIVAIAAVDPPDKPSAPAVDYGLSGANSLFIHWN